MYEVVSTDVFFWDNGVGVPDFEADVGGEPGGVWEVVGCYV
jgi:hypothetical protein